MNLIDGNIYFNKKDIKYKYNYLSENIKTDVLIVGGGITGAITAYYHAVKGLNVVVIDKNLIGYASTSVSTAILEYQIDKDLYKLKKDVGSEAVNSFKECLNSIDEIENIIDFIDDNVDYKRVDSLYFTNNSEIKSLLKEYAERSKYFKVKLEEDNKYMDITASINLKDGSAVMNPYLFTTKLIYKLNKLENVRVYENTECINLENNICKTNNDFNIKYKKCILTDGFYGVNNIKSKTVELYKTFAIVTESLSIDNEFTARDTDDPYHYVRFDNNRIILGGEDIAINKYNEKNARKAYKNLEKTFKNLFPNYKNSKIEYKFNGTFATTKDTLPIIDKIGANVYINYGYGANGILYSVIGARLISENKLKEVYKLR